MNREKKHRIVLDTNVFVSGTLFPDGNEAIILDQVFDDHVRLLTSPEILEEYREVLSRDKFELTSIQVQAIFRRIVSHSEIMLGTQEASVKCRDPDDQKFLDTAFNGKADYVVTGDPDLLAVGKMDDTRIVTAAVFLKILRKNRSRRSSSH